MKKNPFGLRNVLVTEQIYEQKHPGLCINCVHNKTCTFPKAKAGIQFCEEYE